MEPQLAAYIERGDVRFVYKHRIIGGAVSQVAAEAVECAGDQGKWWSYHGTLLTNQKIQGGFSRINLDKFAKDLGLGEPQFASCLEAGKHREKVRQQDAEARALGVSATPSFRINDGEIIRGLPPVDKLMELVNAELKK